VSYGDETATSSGDTQYTQGSNGCEAKEDTSSFAKED
jgi:hypothetical protein